MFNFKNLLIVTVLMPCVTTAQVIATVAGNGILGNTGDGGAATAARISDPHGGVFDNSGNLYIVEGTGHEIRKVDAVTGIITTVAGTGAAIYNGDWIPATTAHIGPNAVAVDTAGNLYISDSARIRRIDRVTGIITTIAGGGSTPVGDGLPATAASIYPPWGLCFDKLGNLYFGETIGYRLRKINTSGILSTVVGNGILGFSGDNGPATAAQCGQAFGVCVDNVGNIYFADAGAPNYRIRKIDTSGIITTVAGTGVSSYSGDLIPATTAHIGPLDVKVDANNNLYIADISNDRIRKVDAISGIISTIAGTGVNGYNGDNILADTAKIYTAGGLAIDACGRVYFGDVGNNRFRKVTFPLTLTNAITASADTACAGIVVTYTASATASSGVITYQWYVNGGPVAGATSTTYSYSPANADSIRCIATATSPCSSATTSSNSIIMVVNPIITPTLTVTGTADTVCSGTSVIYTVTATGATGLSYQWRVNGAPVTGATAATYTYIPANGDSIRCIASSAAPCTVSTTSSNSIIMVVNPIITPTLTVTSTTDTVCSGTSVTFTSAASGGATWLTYQWRVNGSPVTGATTITYTYTPANGDSIRCVANSANPCTVTTTSSNSIIMVVNPIITPTITVTSTTDTVCSGTSVTYTVVATGGVMLTYQWRVNGAPVTGATTITYTYTPANGDSIRCIASSANPCTSAASSNTIYMAVGPIITPTITVAAPATASVGATVTVNATVSGAGSSYSLHWYNNSVLFSTTSIPVTTYTKAAGTDHITATVVPGAGCYDSTTSAESVVQASTTGVSNTSLSFGEGRGEVIYPNPAHSQITITADHLAYVTITNLLGQTMVTKDSKEDQIIINIEAFPAGVYTLKITTTQGEKTTTKFIKQ